MHKFIYPAKDTYINNSSKYEGKNFGIDEILEVYASNKGSETLFTSINWHAPPQTTQSYGNEGWLAYSTSSLYIYSGSMWRKFNLVTDTISGTSFIANFSGRLSNVTTSPKKRLFVSGSAGFSSGSFSGSYNFVNNYFHASGSWTTGSFSGSLRQGSIFTKLNMGPRNYTVSPLTASLTGTGSFKNLRGIINGRSNSGRACCTGFYKPVVAFTSGSFNGTFSSSHFHGFIQTTTSSTLYYADVVNFIGYFDGRYNGTFAQPSTAAYLLYPEFSRTLIKFDLTQLSQSIASNEISSSHIKFTMNLKACGARNLPLDYKIYAYPLSASWENGNGRYADAGSTIGASWDYRNYSGSGLWFGNSISRSYQKLDYLLTSSYATASFKNQGGTWYYDVPASYSNKPKWICSSSFFPGLSGSSLIASQSFTFGAQSDISMDITTMVRSWLCGCVPNNGLILITSLELTTPPLEYTDGLLQFFSKESNTIYSPYLDIAWDSVVFNTGSLAPLTGSTENLINIQYLKQAYKAGSIPKVFVFGRDKYPLKSFSKAYQQNVMVTPKYLPESSYYMIKDAESEEILVDFDRYTKLSCDPNLGNYFIIDTSGLPQERYFKILIKIEYDDGTIDISDTGKIFKIVR